METAFPCLIWDHDGILTSSERSAIAGSVLDAGCRYVVCGGHNCEAWHDETDAEYRKRHPSGIKDSSFVMTSWHEDQSPQEVAFYFVRSTFLPDQPDVDHPFSDYLVVHVGSGESDRPLDAAILKCAVGDI